MKTFPTLSTAPREGGFALDGFWVWDPSVIRGEDGRYHMFCSRWPKSLPFHPGWTVGSEVVRATADSPEGPYQFEDVVLPARGAHFWDGRATHNPRISKFGDTYALFYTGITHPFDPVSPADARGEFEAQCHVAHASKRIGVSTSKSLEGPWRRPDAPALPTIADTFYSYLTSNPSPACDGAGGVMLMFKGRPSINGEPGPMCIGMAHASSIDAPFRVISTNPVFGGDTEHELEDPFLWRTAFGYEMIAKDMTGTHCGEPAGGLHAFSKDGLHWERAPHPLAYSRTIQWRDGEKQTMGSFERAFLLIEDGAPTHLFGATADGPGWFKSMTKSWNMVVPLKSSKPTESVLEAAAVYP